MSTPATNNSIFFLRSFALEGWYEENPHTPKLKDIDEAISAMNFIGNNLGKKYRLLKELDLERTGANTPKKPEARFEFADSKKKRKSVIEIKQFPFEVNKGKPPCYSRSRSCSNGSRISTNRTQMRTTVSSSI